MKNEKTHQQETPTPPADIAAISGTLRPEIQSVLELFCIKLTRFPFDGSVTDANVFSALSDAELDFVIEDALYNEHRWSLAGEPFDTQTLHAYFIACLLLEARKRRDGVVFLNQEATQAYLSLAHGLRSLFGRQGVDRAEQEAQLA